MDAGTPSRPRHRLTRRAFLLRVAGGGLGGLAAATLGAGYARYVEPFWPAVEAQAMDLPQLAPALAGLRIIQLSDLHVDRGMRLDYLREQFQHCLSLAPDLIVLTGDYITRADARYLDELKSLVSLLRAPLGVFAVLGNHDWAVYSAGRARRMPALATGVQAALSAAGVMVLRNECVRVVRGGAALQLVGLDDLWSGCFDAGKAFADTDPTLPCVALTHNPDSIDQLRDQPCDWILCGHTHGGQVRVPLCGAPLLPVRHREYDQGLFHVGGQRLYVNRGLGYLRCVRFNCRPEITLFTLTARA